MHWIIAHAESELILSLDWFNTESIGENPNGDKLEQLKDMIAGSVGFKTYRVGSGGETGVHPADHLGRGGRLAGPL
jgi:hypothetical protein